MVLMVMTRRVSTRCPCHNRYSDAITVVAIHVLIMWYDLPSIISTQTFILLLVHFHNVHMYWLMTQCFYL